MTNNDTQDYDLVIEKDNILETVQVKTTGCKTRYGNYQVALKSCGETKEVKYKTVTDTKVDLLLIVTVDKLMYLIPVNDIKNKSTLTLCKQYEKYKIKNAE